MFKVLLILILLGLVTSGCGFDFGNSTSDNTSGSIVPSTDPIIEGVNKYFVALGGVASGRDQLVFTAEDGSLRDFSGSVLQFEIAKPTVFGLLTRVGFADFAAGSGATIVPQKAGSSLVSYTVDNIPQDAQIGVVVPPQELVQILLGEARGQIAQEVTIDSDGHVTLQSRSPTAEALAAVIRNRVSMIAETGEASLFAADSTRFFSDSPASGYGAVIEASKLGIYFQFEPIRPSDPNRTIYDNASSRNFLDSGDLLAYDQSVLTAGGIFDGSIVDPTDGAFGFRTPSAQQAACLEDAAARALPDIPSNCGPGDEMFPALAPLQIVIFSEVAKLSSGRPAFVFYRSRESSEPAVIISEAAQCAKCKKHLTSN